MTLNIGAKGGNCISLKWEGMKIGNVDNRKIGKQLQRMKLKPCMFLQVENCRDGVSEMSTERSSITAIVFLFKLQQNYMGIICANLSSFPFQYPLIRENQDNHLPSLIKTRAQTGEFIPLKFASSGVFWELFWTSGRNFSPIQFQRRHWRGEASNSFH